MSNTIIPSGAPARSGIGQEPSNRLRMNDGYEGKPDFPLSYSRRCVCPMSVGRE